MKLLLLILSILRGRRVHPMASERCSRWGCLLPVGTTSPWGPGPLCSVCRYGLRAVAFPSPSENPLTPEVKP